MCFRWLWEHLTYFYADMKTTIMVDEVAKWKKQKLIQDLKELNNSIM